CAVELDRNLLPVLEETLSPYENASVVWGDVLKTDLPALADEKFGAGSSVCAVSNLPYCVTTPAILLLLGCGRFESVTVMIQKEAAKKLICAPGDPEWCLFSALCARRAKTEKLFAVSKGCFYPQPKVDSTVLHMTCLPAGTPEEEEAYENVAKAIFAQRRKTVKNTLSKLPGVGAEGAEKLLTAAEIDQNRRGETLDPEEIGRVSALMVQTIQKDPARH
ncbi:MAG: 16S rRNA (adenine(1518)-N(6)/adenine(1519)-N(6))-dimethyltransferase, partial [Clostridia bacterium]|nr:16S rRNA (adenine(1518)-N(6)/adenine(1519)-N(6))-dimethyltransferase [Clostridia bacterium]